MIREEALHVLNDMGRYCLYYMGEATRQNNWERYERLLMLYQTAEIAIEALRQPEQKQKKGKWEHDKKLDFYRCSICQHYVVRKYPYCMYCGAEMEVEE